MSTANERASLKPKKTTHRFGTEYNRLVIDAHLKECVIICAPNTMRCDTIIIPNEHLRDIIRVLVKEQNRRGL